MSTQVGGTPTSGSSWTRTTSCAKSARFQARRRVQTSCHFRSPFRTELVASFLSCRSFSCAPRWRASASYEHSAVRKRRAAPWQRIRERKRNKKVAVHPCPEHLGVHDTRKSEVGPILQEMKPMRTTRHPFHGQMHSRAPSLPCCRHCNHALPTWMASHRIQVKIDAVIAREMEMMQLHSVLSLRDLHPWLACSVALRPGRQHRGGQPRLR